LPQVLSPLILSKLNKYTGFDDIYMYNALETSTPATALYFEPFLNSSCMRRALHVGSRQYNFLAVDVYTKFLDADFYTSTKSELEKLLNSAYRVLIYSSQFDLIVTHVGVSRFLETLSWAGSTEFEDTPREIWRVNKTIAGYVRKYDNLVHVLIRNAGHAACFDQNLWCEDMVTKFSRDLPFDK
jgi:vitellogenic carboxypeptidase-like protein